MSVRVLVVGHGTMGRRRLRSLRDLGVDDVAVCSRTADLTTLGVPGFTTLDEAADWRPTAVLVATETSSHLAGARWAINHDCDVFVEKPLAASLAGVDDLLDQAEAAGRRIAVGYTLRFHPALLAIKQAVDDGRIGRLLTARAEVGQYLPDWHPDRDYRESYAARADGGGGALLTLSHELDYMLWIAGPVTGSTGIRARVSELELDVDDTAAVICRHGGGALSTVQSDFLDRSYNRRSRWIGELGTIDWQWGEPVRLGDEQLWSDPGFDLETVYVAELAAFLAGDAGGATGTDARAVQAIVEEAACLR